jgi:hypothetical protein
VSPLAAEQIELLRALARPGVEFVVVGGVGAQVHGWHGATVDLDIAVATDESNVEREKDRAALPQMRQDFLDADTD